MTMIYTQQNKKKSNNADRLYREIKLYLYLMSKLCIPMESCTFLSFYCKYILKK